MPTFPDNPLLLDALFERTPDAIVVIDGDGRYVAANPAAERLFGQPAGALVGRSAADFVPAYEPTSSSRRLRAPGTMQGEFMMLDNAGNAVYVGYTGITAAANGLSIFTLRDLSDRKRTEQQLEQSETRLRLAQTAARMGAWEWTIPTNEVAWSPEMEGLFGLEPGAYSGEFDDYIARIHEEDREAVQRSIEGLVATGRHDIQHRIVLPNGEVRWLHARGQVFHDAAGAPARAVGVGMDITEQKRAEDALNFVMEASRELAASLDYAATLRRVSELAVPRMADWCSVYVLDEQGIAQQVAITHVNPEKVAWAKELQRLYPPDPNAEGGVSYVLRTGESEFVPEITGAMIEAADFTPEQRAIVNEIGFSSYLSVPMIIRDHVFGALTLVYAESGRRYTSADLEVAQHLARRAAAAIENARVHTEAERQRARLASLFESITAGLIQIDRDGRVTHVNPAGADLLGCGPSELLGIDFHATVHDEHALEGQSIPASECPILAVARSGEPYRGETWFVRMDGVAIPVEVTSSPVVVDGEVEGAVVVFLDIAHRLEQQRLKDDFLAFASHELRSPLTPITGLSRWLAQEVRANPALDSGQVREVVTELESEAERMASVVELFLDLSRIDAGHVSLDLELADVARIARQVVERVASRFNVAANVQCTPARIVAETDEGRLRQVLSNLVENAAKYGGDASEIRVTVELRGDETVFQVTDSGPGIPADDLPRIFERFFRSSAQRVQLQKGFGLGLFLTRELVRAAGGSISVSSQPGHGTTFTVHWPTPQPPDDIDE